MKTALDLVAAAKAHVHEIDIDAADAANAATLLAAVTSLGVPPAPTIGDGSVTFVPAIATLDRCTTLQPIVVPIGTRVLRSRAITPTGRSDTDQLRLRCSK